MNDLYRFYLCAFWDSIIINPLGDGVFCSPSRSKENVFHMIHYDGTGLPMCSKETCEAARFGMPCAHQAATIAYCHKDIQRAWDHRRIFEARSLWLSIRQGKTNPRRHPKIRRAMDEINQRHPVTTTAALCTRCGLVLAEDMCAECWGELRKIWPDDPAGARKLERQDADERWRLKLGMGE